MATSRVGSVGEGTSDLREVLNKRPEKFDQFLTKHVYIVWFLLYCLYR
jgi:hypothetical protein